MKVPDVYSWEKEHTKEGDMEDRKSNTAAYACSYVPGEIIMAAGLSPMRLVPAGGCSDADSHIHPNTCCYVRSMLADLLKGKYRDVRTMVFANSCDAMRKLFDIWSDSAHHPPALFLDIPKRKDRASLEFFTCELQRLAHEIEEKVSGSAITRASLDRAIHECNKVRQRAEEIFTMQADPLSGIRGMDVLPLILEPDYKVVARHAERIGRDRGALRETPRRSEGPGILLTGSIVARPETIEMIEGAGARLTGFDTCFGLRHYGTLVREGSPEPFEAIAERYLMRPPCPRMEGVKDQVEHLKRLAARTGADGVIISAVKYCDQIFYQLPLLKEGIEDMGLPVLILENDYEWSGLEKARIRVEAFLEMIAQRRPPCSIPCSEP